MMRLVQLQNAGRRVVALVDEPVLRPLSGTDSTYALALEATAGSATLAQLVRNRVTDERLDYDEIYAGASAWRLMTPVDHPDEPARCLVSGTGLTHVGSATSRGAMHAMQTPVTDSLRMFRAGLEGGRPAAGRIGAAPEWFYKGNGASLRAHREALDVPGYAGDGGEEAEIAGLYLIDAAGRPRRIGMTAGNEFSDHQFEKSNYLNLAGSKLRSCAIGPELVVDPEFRSIQGRVSIERHGRTIWEKDIATGEDQMCHSLANLEHHHFKFDAHRRPGDLHVHFFGAQSLSFADGVKLVDDDVIVIQFDGFGRALRNPVAVGAPLSKPIIVHAL